MTGHHSTTIDGIVFDALDEHTAVRTITAAAAAGRGGFVITPNVSILRQLRDPEHTELAASADLVLADGMPIVWASRMTPSPLPERVCGSALIWSVSRGAADAGLPVMLLGGAEGVAERGAGELAAAVPGLRTSWHFPPLGFETDRERVDDVVAAVHDAGARIVFVGLGFPKQERLIMRLRRQFPEVWFIGCGAALTFAAGDIARAPGWMQDRGVEWVHRLVKEPRRLARRYLVGDLPFAVALLLRMLVLRVTVAASRPATGPAGLLGAPADAGAGGTRPTLRLLRAPSAAQSTTQSATQSGSLSGHPSGPGGRRRAEAEQAAS